MNSSDYSRNIQDILKRAKKQALSSNHKYVDLCHLFYAMITNNESNVCKILVSIGCSVADIKKQLNVDFFNQSTSLSSYSSTHIPLSQNSDFILRQSIKEARNLGYKKPDDRHLFLALIKEANSIAKVVLPEPGRPIINIFFIFLFYEIACLVTGFSTMGK